jgi:hypothetical protein
VVHAVASAVQESGAVQICQEAMYGADRQPGEACYLLCRQSAWRFAKELQKAQPALQSRDVVAAFWMVEHKEAAPRILKIENESANYLMKSSFPQGVSFLCSVLINHQGYEGTQRKSSGIHAFV